MWPNVKALCQSCAWLLWAWINKPERQMLLNVKWCCSHRCWKNKQKALMWCHCSRIEVTDWIDVFGNQYKIKWSRAAHPDTMDLLHQMQLLHIFYHVWLETLKYETLWNLKMWIQTASVGLCCPCLNAEGFNFCYERKFEWLIWW